MRSSIAIAAAIVGAVNASPAKYGGYGGGYESVVYSTSTPAPYATPSSYAAPVYSTPAPYSAPVYSEAPVYSAPVYSAPAPYSSEAPVYSAPVYSAPVYNSSAVPYITKTVYTTSLYTVTSCAAYVTDCPAHSTIVYTTVVPAYTTVCPADETETYPTATPYAPESSVYYAESTSCAESSTVTVVVPVSTPYPTGTGAVPYPSGGSTAIWGTASSSGYLTPSASYPPEFTGAASHANAGLAVAGLGAFAALFL